MLYLKKRSKNKNGSVLLAVVIVSMLLLCLATVSLHVVNYTAKATSRNVQRTQAKVTAEAALQEFVDRYEQGWTLNHPGATEEEAKKRWEDLEHLAAGGTVDSPIIYEVTVGNGAADPFQTDFNHNFGETELHLYSVGTNKFKVEAVTTYSTVTQTASISFGRKSSTKSIPSNTYESKKGNATGSDQIAMGVDGTMYIENSNNGVPYKKVSRADYHAHISIQQSVVWDDQTFVTDVLNKSIDNVYKKTDRYFKQAPAIMIEGYSAAMNNFYMGTSVGKSDVNGVNSTYTGGDYAYASDNLGGYDGFYCCFKKFAAWKNGNWRIGYDKTGNNPLGPIDVFCHGYYDGNLCGTNSMPSSIDGMGTFNPREECNNVKAMFDPAFPGSGFNAEKRDHKFKVNGDMHVYRGTSGEDDENGALVMAYDDAASAASGALTINGDLYIDGDIIIISNNGNFAQDLIDVSGTIHMPGGNKIIYVVNNGADTNIHYASELTGTNLPGITCAGHDEDIPNSAYGRHFMPRRAYMALTGHMTMEDSHAYLQASYEGASTNDIFTASIADDLTAAIGNATYRSNLGAGDQAAAQNIGAKFADAMMHTIDGEHGGLSTFKDTTGAVKQVCQEYATMSNGAKVKQINASCRLTYEQAQYKYNNKENIYLINLRDQDIVIALPFGDFGATFKVVNKNPADHHYVYFMWYDDGGRGNLTEEQREQAREQCWYINNASLGDSYAAAGLPAGGTEIPINGTQEGVVYNAVALSKPGGSVITSATRNAIVATDPSDCRRKQTINFGTGSNGNHDRWITSDYLLTDVTELDSTTVNVEELAKASILASIAYNGGESGDVVLPSESRSLIDNCIMFLVPDYVGITYDPAGGRNGLKVQGVLYAWNSEFNIVVSSGTVWYGQLKVDRLNFMDDTGCQWLRDLPMGEGSLLSFAARNSSSETTEETVIQFYDY